MITLSFSKAQTVTLRAVRLSSLDGTVSVLLTNLIDTTDFLPKPFALYFRAGA